MDDPTTSTTRAGRAPMHRPLLCTAALAALALPAVGAAQSQVYDSSEHSFRVVTVAEGLVNPWSIAFLPNGDLLVTERGGALRIVREGEVLEEPVAGVPPVRAVGQGGLQDVVLHPDFESNRLVYVSFAKPNADDSEGTTAVVRGRFENDRLNDVEEIFEAQPYSDSPGHYGARMVFDDEGYLFVSSGDRMAPSTGDLEAHTAQDLSTHHGTIVRLHDDGSVPDDNPFVGSGDALPEIWSYGHRNPQGLAIDPAGELWSTEHGPQGGDELNHIRPGTNYGWPVIGYGMNYGAGTKIHETRNREGMAEPEAFWVPSIAPSGLAIYTGDEFPMWNGDAFAGGLSAQHQRLSRLMLEDTRMTNRESLLAGEMRIRDVRDGPDGYIYIAIDNSFGMPTSIVRLEPAD